MKVNLAVSAHNSADWPRYAARDFASAPGQADPALLTASLELGDMAEPLGFDGIWAGQHFGTPYNLTPNPLQTLAYFAGRTERVGLGTIVLVLPWWNPVDLAHQIAYLDTISNGRFDMIGLGRGVSKFEFDALNLDRNESRDRFTECVDILELALTQERFAYEGKHHHVPETSIRPSPLTPDLPTRFYAAASTGSSVEAVARRGLKPLFVGNKSLAAAGEDVRRVNGFRRDSGLEPCQPNNILFMYCVANEAEAADAAGYMAAANRDVCLHYGLDDAANFAGVKGYEDYAAGAGNATALSEDRSRPPANSTYDESNLLIGTPDTIMQRVIAGQKACSFKEICIVPNFGTMPHDVSRRSLQLFAREVLPNLQAMDAPLHASAIAEPAAVAA